MPTGLCTEGHLHLHSRFPVDMHGASGRAHAHKCKHIKYTRNISLLTCREVTGSFCIIFLLSPCLFPSFCQNFIKPQEVGGKKQTKVQII